MTRIVKTVVKRLTFLLLRPLPLFKGLAGASRRCCNALVLIIFNGPLQNQLKEKLVLS